MSDEQQHINPWAGKLQQVPLPDAGASWKGMESLLAQHMPIPEKKKRRWFPFLLFSMLLIGISSGSFMIYQHLTKDKSIGANTKVVDVKSTDSNSNFTALKDKTSTVTTGAGNSNAPTSSLDSIKVSLTTTAGNTNNNIGSNETRAPIVSKSLDSAKTIASAATNKKTSVKTAKNSKEPAIAGMTSLTKKNNKPEIHKRKERLINTAISDAPTATINETNRNIKKNSQALSGTKPFIEANQGANSKVDTAIAVGKGSVVSGKQSDIPNNNNTASARNALLPYRSRLNPMAKLAIGDSLKLTKSSVVPDNNLQVLKSKKQEEIRKGWTFGIGLNHYFPTHRNSEDEFDSEGISGNIADYIPVPQARYYFNNKLYVQGELQINAPQFTQNIVLQQNRYQQGSLLISDTVYIKKLSYINLPLSLHYSPVKNLFIGTGIQFSRLNNAIASYQQTERNLQSPMPDSAKVYKTSVKSLKNDTLYKRLHTTEFRLLGDINYQIKRFTVGARYNYALSSFVKVPITSSDALTQARNSSLQLYIRYRFLDKRKRVQPKSK